MLVLEKGAFIFKVGCFKSSYSLMFINAMKGVTEGEILTYLYAIVEFARRIEIGRTGENGCDFALFEGG